MQKLISQKNILLQEMSHRIANSLQLIASILLLKSDGVVSDDARRLLHDAHERILTIATVQRQLDSAGMDIDKIDVGKYLSALCGSLAKSMISQQSAVLINVESVISPG